MLIKRLILVVISLVFGFGTTFVIVELIGTNVEQYGIWYTAFTALSLAFALAVWLDKFMGTKILPK